MPSNIEQLKEQNKLLEAARATIESQNTLLKTQSNLIEDIVKEADKLGFKSVVTDANQLTQALREASEQSNQSASSQSSFYQEVRKQIGSATDDTKGLTKVLGQLAPIAKKSSVLTSFFSGLRQGIGGVTSIAKGFGSLAGGMAKTLGHIALSLIRFPFALLSNLIHDASQGGSNELQQALEDIRKEFGYLNKTAGGAIVTLGRSMKGELANTGLSVYRVFGNLAERLKFFTEYAKNLGETLDAAMRNIDPRRDAEALGAFNKALGFTAEGQKAIAQRSVAAGRRINDINLEIANYAIQLSSAFGVTMKEVSRDVGKMMSDFQHFGHLGVQQLTQISVYTRRLGLDFKQLGAVMDKFTNFEDAAQGAAQLSQAFGLNIDAFKLMQEQDPAKKLEMLRKSFFAAGRSIENMTYQERRLLAQQTGLDDAGVQLAFSLKSQSLSYADITKKGDAAKKSQLTQAQAMEKLAGAIERMVQSGSAGGGFLDRFIRGFVVGIKWSREYRQIMINLRRDLMSTYYAGIRVGRAFVESFPGIKDWFNGISGIFQPQRFRAMLNKVVSAFKDFFKDLQDDPRAGFRKFIDRLKIGFTSWFDRNSANGQKMLNGFKAFFKAFANIFAEGLKMAIEGVTKGIRFIVNIIQNPSMLSGAGAAAGGTAAWVLRTLTPIWEAIKESWPALKTAFVDLWHVALPHIKNALGTVFRVGWPLISAMIFGPAFSRAIITSFGGAFVGALGRGAAQALPSVLNVFKGFGGSITKAVPRGMGNAGTAVAESIRGASSASQAAQESKISASSIGKMALITLFITVGMAGVLFAIFEFAKAMKNNHLTIENIAGAALAMITTATTMVAIAGAIKLLSAIDLKGNFANIAIGLGVVALVGGAMAVAAYAMINAFKNFNLSDIGKTALVMGATGAFFLAAGAVAGIALLVGASILSTGGLGAVAITIGLAAIATIISQMVDQGLAIMSAINRFRPEPGFAEKARAFGEILKGIGSFAASVAQIASATQPGILSFIVGVGAEEQQQTLRSVGTLIQTLGGQIIAIINAVKASIGQLTGGERELKSAQVLGDLLSGVGSLAKALAVPTEALAEPGLFDRFLGAEDVSRKVNSLTRYVSTIGPQLNGLINSLVTVMTGQLSSGLTENQKRAGDVFAAILGGVGQLATALRPSPELIREINKGADFTGQLTQITGFVTSIINVISGSAIFTKIGELFTAIINTTSNLTARQIDAVKAVTPIVGPMFTAISSIANVLGSFTAPARSPKEDQTAAIFQLTGLITTFFTRIKDDLPALVSSMRTAFAGMTPGQATALAKGMEGVSKFFETIATIPNVLKGIRESFGPNATTANMNDMIVVTLDNFLTLLRGSGAVPGLTRILGALVVKLTEITASITNPAAFVQKINAIKTIFEVLGGIPAMLKGFADTAATGGGIVDQYVMVGPLLNLSRIINGLASPLVAPGVANPLVNDNMKNILERGRFTGISQALKNRITQSIESIKDIGAAFAEFGNIPDTANSITQAQTRIMASLVAFSNLIVEDGPWLLNMANTLPTFVTQIRDTHFAGVSKGLIDMVSQINHVSEELSGIHVADVNLTMRNVANVLGVKSETLTLQHRNFAINVNVNVQMDAAQIETAIVDRPTSRIDVRPVAGLPALTHRNR